MSAPQLPSGIKVEPAPEPSGSPAPILSAVTPGAIVVPRSLSTAQLRGMTGPRAKRSPRIPARKATAWEVPPNAKRDAVLDRLATDLGFQSKNVLARVFLNEISYCPKTAFFKAIAQFTRYSRQK